MTHPLRIKTFWTGPYFYLASEPSRAVERAFFKTTALVRKSEAFVKIKSISAAAEPLRDKRILLGHVTNQPLLDIRGQLLPHRPKPVIVMIREECNVGRSGSLQ
jgi:hypothetical protein